MAIDDLGQLIGRSVLVSIRYLDADGEVASRLQFAGIVTAVDPLVEIDHGDDVPFTLLPEPDAFDPAPPGEYRLRESGETVVDPDVTSTWTVTPPPSRSPRRRRGRRWCDPEFRLQLDP
ncbi:MAG: hypothetical protein QNJ12_03660 [Ilumatobacter sp.]|uniref:hypothetical protein n=1 Tax=Ilumatobacter sp. TaxID=1967498 RepID=UPI0026096F64|nr:hypothetical protein [Ilumatobacter sp.]MDJ0767859.1 hypothetical protein [Ilumatobacter sp.]